MAKLKIKYIYYTKIVLLSITSSIGQECILEKHICAQYRWMRIAHSLKMFQSSRLLELDFAISERPTWRSQTSLPSTMHMLKDIMCHSDSGNYWSDDEQIDVFVNNICQQEEIGIQEYTVTQSILNQVRDQVESLKTYSQEQQVTVNVFRAWTHLRSHLSNEDDLKGLLDVDECIRKTHIILMKDLDQRGGEFSISERFAQYKGIIHTYPRYYRTEDVESDLWRIIDRYNEMITSIKRMPKSVQRIGFLVKCASWLTYKITSLHPFGDGNGRLCHILCSYCLGVFSPFPTPLGNVVGKPNREHYIDALICARTQDLSHLASLVLESYWIAWKKCDRIYNM
jgi:hypothetical protein